MTFIRYLVLLFFCLLFSCKQNTNISHDKHLTDNLFSDAKSVKAITPLPINLKNSAVTSVGAYQKQNSIIKDWTPPQTYTPVGGLSGGLSHINSFSNEQGLSLSSIASSYLDKKGNLWFGTYGGGVNKYDGKSFTVYNSSNGLANNIVLSILEDKRGNMWFGTQGGGVSKFDGRVFTTYNISNGLADNIIYSIIEDKQGYLWFATKNAGVVRYLPDTLQSKNSTIEFLNNNTIKNFTTTDGFISSTIRCIYEAKNGDLWFASEGDGICKYNGTKFEIFNTTHGLCSNTIWCITEDYLGNMWFGSNGNGVSKYDFTKFKTYTTRNGLAHNIVWAISEDKHKNLWFGTEGNGVSVLNYKIKGDSTSLFTSYNTSHGLSNNIVFTIVEDKEENIWFGTYGGGVSRYNGDAFVTYNAKQGLASNVVFSITQDKHKNLWFGSYGAGVTMYNGQSFTKYNTNHGLANNTIWSVLSDSKDRLWLGTNGGGVSMFDGTHFVNYNTSCGLPGNIIRCIKEDKYGNIWFGSDGGGVSKFNGANFITYKVDNGLLNNTVRCMLEDSKGNLWFGTEGSGVSKFDGKYFSNYSTLNGLVNNVVRNICEDKQGNIWFATQAGISCYNNQLNKNNSYFINYTTEQGLPDDYVTQIEAFKNSKIIAGTNNGIVIFDAPKSITAINNLVDLEVFNVSNNYPVKDVNIGQKAIFVDDKNIIWIATGDDKASLVRFDYEKLIKKSSIVLPKILSVKINNQKIDWYSLLPNKDSISSIDSLTTLQQQIATYKKTLSLQEIDSLKKQFNGVTFNEITPFHSVPQHLILPFNHNNITIEFRAPHLSKSFMINYQYYLEGYDNSWNPVTKNTDASFGNINAGDYVFKVKAQSPEGNWSEPIEYKFTVLPPFYRTIWAYLFYLVAGYYLLQTIIKWRVASFKRRQLELEKVVDERTVEVVKQKEEAEHQKELVQKKQEEMLDSINYAKRIQSTLLGNKQLINSFFIENFILFKPKDIVSGDFYWTTHHNNKFYLAVCDCTGHGVPGAFMSLLNMGFLSEAIVEKGIEHPNEIFDYVRMRLEATVSSDGQRDGMDGILLKVEIINNQLTIEYAAANNEPILIKNQAGLSELIELPKDKMPIGIGEKIKPFTLHKLEVNAGDTLYLYTDGYADQFGGPKGKKFKYKQLNELLLANQMQPFAKQATILDKQFEEWRNNLEQVDDVLIIGIKIY